MAIVTVSLFLQAVSHHKSALLGFKLSRKLNCLHSAKLSN